jgi:tetratricopeptide (TPR) repeat protein
VDADARPEQALAVYRDLATLLERAGDPAAAEAPLRKALALIAAKRKTMIAATGFTPKEADAEAAETYERLGKILVKAKKAEPAAEAFRAAHALYADPRRVNDPAAAARLDWNLSGAFAAKGDPATALLHLEAFLKLRPQAAEPYERLVALLNQLGRGGQVVPALKKYLARDEQNLPLTAVLAAELARDPDGRAAADGYFAQLSAATNDPKVVRAVIRALVETGQARQVVAELDQAYQGAKAADGEPAGDRQAFAAEKARVIGDALRAEPEWAAAVLRAAADDLRTGTQRTHQTWYVFGTLAARHRKLDLAAVQLRQAVRTAPKETQADAYSALIDVLWRGHKPADVAAVCRDGLRDPNGFVAPAFFNFHLAYALAELGDADEAVAAADKAILQAGDTDRLTVRLRKAMVLKVLGRWDDAIGLCGKLLDEFDAPADRLRVRYTLATAYWGAKKFAAAEAELRAILDADPDHAGACNDLGYHLAEQGRKLDEAERLLRHAVAVDRADRRAAGDPEPESAAYLDSLAWVLFRQGKAADARVLLEKVTTMPEGAADAVVWDHLGDVYFRSDEKAKAKAAWDRAAALYATDSRGTRDGLLDEVKRKLKRVP